MTATFFLLFFLDQKHESYFKITKNSKHTQPPCSICFWRCLLLKAPLQPVIERKKLFWFLWHDNFSTKSLSHLCFIQNNVSTLSQDPWKGSIVRKNSKGWMHGKDLTQSKSDMIMITFWESKRPSILHDFHCINHNSLTDFIYTCCLAWSNASIHFRASPAVAQAILNVKHSVSWEAFWHRKI